MSFFTFLLKKNNLSKHDGRPLWKYMLGEDDFQELKDKLKFARPYDIDARDVTLFYTEWWKRKYNGGVPSKEIVFNALEGNIKFNFSHNEFYRLAKKGAEILNINWLKKQNTLYFRTLLLQGGLPLCNISENQGKYQNFLMAVLEEQPETIEDFIFKTHITELLPSSSQNEIIYENCLEIVKSIISGDDEYENLLDSDSAISEISKTLKIRAKTLEKKQRLSKPKNYWVLDFNENELNIKLRIGLADSYDIESLANILGFKIKRREYQFYIDDQLICIFRRMTNDRFKTDWYQQKDLDWQGEIKLPYSYVLVDGKKIVVEDFIQTIPQLTKPSLWANFSDHEWFLIKGNGTSNKQAAVLFPSNWETERYYKDITIESIDLCWLVFEGELNLKCEEQVRTYLSQVKSFDWTIVSQRPQWMLKANMPVVQRKPIVHIYDEDNKKLPESKYKLWIKRHNSLDFWDELSRLSHIPVGCIDLKIVKNDIVAYDVFFNIGHLKVDYTHKSIDKANITFRNFDYFDLKIDESDILNIQIEGYSYSLKVKTEFSRIPTTVSGSIGNRNKKKLFFEMESPFEGMAITDANGTILPEDQQISLTNLYGLRILCAPNSGTLLRLRNKLKSDVKIIEEIKESSQPIISFKDKISRLFYLADAMDYKNKVCLELIEDGILKSYEISGFSHTLDVDQQKKTLSLYDSNENLDLFAVPLNCLADSLEIIPLLSEDSSFSIPKNIISNQFIIISSNKNGHQIMPRFVQTDDVLISVDKNERIELYHSELSITDLTDEIWKQILAYFNICNQHDLPYSTFDQLRAISRSSIVAAKAFFFLGFNYPDPENFIQKIIVDIENDLGFCFHWVKKDDWEKAFIEINRIDENKYQEHILNILSSYMKENNLYDLFKYIMGEKIEPPIISHRDIRDLRAKLGERVLRELPNNSPKITQDYNIPISHHLPVRLLLQSPIAVAESINNTDEGISLWAGNEIRETIRRNIQYCQYLNPAFYNKVALHALNKN